MKRDWTAARKKVEREPAPLEDERKGVKRRRVLCPDCNEERRVYADTNVLTCRACSIKARRNGDEVECPGCGTSHYISQGYIERGIRYCSIDCFNENYERKPISEATREKLSESKRGKRNPNYKHGKKAGTKRAEERAFNVYKKGEHRCRVCGRCDNLHAHHAVPRSLAPSAKADLRNCLVLCASCHMAWHRGRAITRDHFTAEEWAYVSTLIGPAWLDKKYPKREAVVIRG